MSKKAEDKPDHNEPKGGRPGPVDHAGSGGMASREIEADEAKDAQT